MMTTRAWTGAPREMPPRRDVEEEDGSAAAASYICSMDVPRRDHHRAGGAWCVIFIMGSLLLLAWELRLGSRMMHGGE